MLALRVHSFDSLDSLALDEVPQPQPGPGQVRVKVQASAISFVDLLRAEGNYQVRSALPFIGGSEFAGIVDAVGPGVSGLEAGQTVAGLASGAWAQYVCAPHDMVYPVQADTPPAEAASLPAAFCTVLYGLAERGNLQPGETVLVLGAAGSIGHAAVQVAKALGARVIAGASTAEKREAARQAGADEVLDTSTGDWKDAAKALAGPDGVDIVLDPVGGAATDTAFRTLGWKGRHLMVGFASGDIGRLGTNLAIVKGASLVGVDMRAFREREPQAAAAVMKQVVDLHAQGKIRPLIAATLPVQQFADAVRRTKQNTTAGRIVLSF